MGTQDKVVSIRDQIANQLRQEIIDGELAENSRLGEQVMAKRFGVSRGPIRDVFIELTKEGLLTSHNNRGVTIASPLSQELQVLVVQLRVAIETFAVSSIVNTLDERDFAALEQLIEDLGRAFEEGDYSSVTSKDIDFHAYIVEKAGGDELLNIWRPIIYKMRMNYKRIRRAGEAVAEHTAILSALKARDGEAAVAALKSNVQ